MKRHSKMAWVEALRTAVAIGIALLIVFVIVLCVSSEPLNAIFNFLFGPLTTVRRMGNVVEEMIPIMFTGLSIVILYRTGLFNLSAEGGFFLGAVVAAIAALTLPLPPVLNLLAAMVLAAIAGGVTSLIPGILKVKCGANEIVTSLMLNYVCLNVGLYFIQTFFIDPEINSKYTYQFPASMELPTIIPGTRVHAGLIIAILCVVACHFILERTPLGYKATLVGSNGRMAKYSGVSTAAVIIGTQFLGGALAGLGGSVELFGMYRRFQYLELTNYGWDGILIAIVARHKPKYVPLAALFLAYLRIGADIMSRTSDVPFEIVKIIQAVVIVLISAQAILSGFRKKMIVKETQELENKAVSANG